MEAKNPQQQKHKRSLGENIYDTALYTGIGFAVNTVLSIYLTYQLKRKNPEIFPQLGQKYANWTRSLGMKTNEATAKFGENAIENITLLSGGFIVLPFIKWGEEGRKEPIHAINKALGGAEPQITELEDGTKVDVLDLKPKQSWGSVLGGRIGSIALGYGPLFALFGKYPDYYKGVEKAIVSPVFDKLPRFVPKDTAMKVTASKEVISSAITTATLLVFSRAIASTLDWWSKRKEEGKGGLPRMAGAIQPSSSDRIILPSNASDSKKDIQNASKGNEPNVQVDAATLSESRLSENPQAQITV